MRTLPTALIVLLVVAFTGCSSDRAAAGPATTTVGTAGGKVASGDGRLELAVPSGAVDTDTAVQVVPIDDKELPTGALPGTGFELTPDGIAFKKPVRLTLTYGAEAVGTFDSQWLRLVQLLPGGTVQAVKLIAHDEAARKVTAELTHFSKYALADLKAASATLTTTKQKLTDVDVLFLVDNSGSMDQEQANLAANFPAFITKLDAAQIDYRIGVVSPDLGASSYNLPSCENGTSDGGKLHNAPTATGCPVPTEPWIEKIAGKTNVPGDDVAAAFSCIARLGIEGCGFEQTLEAIYKAVDPAVNPGFIRAKAALAVVIISDEDDCSAKDSTLFDPSQQTLTDPLGPLTSFRCFEFGVTCDVNDREKVGPRANCKPTTGGKLHDVQRYVDRLTQLKPAGGVVVSLIAGALTPVVVGEEGATNNPKLEASCESAAGFAVPPIRLAAFAAAFGPAATTHSICDEDLSPALAKAGQIVVEQAQLNWCLPFDPIDVDPSTPALDGDCQVSGPNTGALPVCAATDTKPCYRLATATACATSQTMIELVNIPADRVGDDYQAICHVP